MLEWLYYVINKPNNQKKLPIILKNQVTNKQTNQLTNQCNLQVINPPNKQKIN